MGTFRRIILLQLCSATVIALISASARADAAQPPAVGCGSSAWTDVAEAIKRHCRTRARGTVSQAVLIVGDTRRSACSRLVSLLKTPCAKTRGVVELKKQSATLLSLTAHLDRKTWITVELLPRKRSKALKVAFFEVWGQLETRCSSLFALRLRRAARLFCRKPSKTGQLGKWGCRELLRSFRSCRGSLALLAFGTDVRAKVSARLGDRGDKGIDEMTVRYRMRGSRCAVEELFFLQEE